MTKGKRRMFDAPRRNHFTIVLERAGAVIAALVVLGVRMLEDYGWDMFRLSLYRTLLHTALNGGAKTGLYVVLGGAGLLWYLYISVRYWRLTTFYVDDTDFVYARKTMFRAESRLPIRNIAVVNVERNIFERLIGTAKVKIDLNSSKTASSTDFKFVLRLEEARQLKETLMQIKQTLTGEAMPDSDSDSAQPAGEAREQVAFFTVPQALRHKLLSMPVINWTCTFVMLFILPQLRISGDYNMSRLWFLLVIAVLGWVWSIVNGTLNLGNYKVEKDSRTIYITCGVINQRQYVFETDKINAVMVNQPLLARFFGLASIDLAVVGFGNERNETTHLCLISDRQQIDAVLRACVPDFICTAPVQHSHPLKLVKPVLRAFLVGGAMMLFWTTYRGAWILALIVFAVALIGAISEYLISDFAADRELVRYTGGSFNKRTCMCKYGDIQDMRVQTNVLYRRLGLSSMRFTILAAVAARKHKTGWYRDETFVMPPEEMVAHQDNVLKAKRKEKQ